jgi:hypothetical protein
MIELLTKIGIPSLSALLLAVGAAIIWKYFNHRLEIQRRQFESELSLIQSIHRDRFDAVDKIYWHLAELFHNLNHIHEAEEKESRREGIQRHVIGLRSLVREKALILGESILAPAYAVTDFATAVAKGECSFAQDRWFKLEQALGEECRAVLKSIPRVSRELKQIGHAKRGAEQPREPDA